MSEPLDFRGRAPSGGTRQAVAVAVVVVVLIVVAVAKPWDALPREAQPSSAPEASDRSPAPSGPTPTGSALASPLSDDQLRFGFLPPQHGGAWTSVRWDQLPPNHPATGLQFVVPGPTGFVAVGDGGSGDTPVWWSPDGGSWNPVPFGMSDTFWPGAAFVGAASTPTGVILLSRLRQADGCGATPSCQPFLPGIDAWTSKDGLRWTPSHIDAVGPTDDPPNIHIGAAGATAVILWTPRDVPGAARTSVVVSSGRGWQLMPDGTLPAAFEVTDTGTLHGRLIATGRLVNPFGAARAAVASSTDGRTWQVSPLPALTGATRGEDPVVARIIAAGPDGALVTGSAGDAVGAEVWWQSRDGVAWTPVSGFPPLGALPCPSAGTNCGLVADGLVVGDGTRIAAVGGGGASPSLGTWTSSDGAAWQRLDAAGAVPTGAPSAVVLLPGGIVVQTEDGAWYGAARTVPG